MNEYDSQCIAGEMLALGFKQVERQDEADIILFNTCSVREHAVQKFYTILAETKKFKKKKPDLVVGICGCVAEQEKNRLFNRFPWVQLVAGPGSVAFVAEGVKGIIENKTRIIKTGEFGNTVCRHIARDGHTIAYVPVIRGCNNFCSYCVVPYLRGREKSRPASEIIAEVKQAVKDGYREIILLGQNVCAYRDPEQNNDFPALLKKVSEIEGVEKIRFLTSHPKDITEELIRTIAGTGKIAREFHLPLQSGSNKVLKAMNRGYTGEYYLDLIKTIRSSMPDAFFSTDIIVGFPGETEEDFEQTLKLFREIKFDNAFMFKYSDRPNTEAMHIPGKIEEKEKAKRLNRLIKLNAEIIQENRKQKGKILNKTGGRDENLPEERKGTGDDRVHFNHSADCSCSTCSGKDIWR